MGEDNLREIAVQLKRIADCLELMTGVPKVANVTKEQMEDLERALEQEPISLVDTGKGAHQDIVEAWNNELVPLGIPKVNSIKNKRAKLVAARIREYGKESFFKCIEEVKASSFLQGKTTKPWTGFNFDWMICPSNYPKVLEGNYNDERKKSNIEPMYGNSLPESWAR